MWLFRKTGTTSSHGNNPSTPVATGPGAPEAKKLPGTIQRSEHAERDTTKIPTGSVV